MVAFVFPMALGTTLMPMMAQNFGAGLYQRVKDCLRISLHFSFWFLFIIGLVYVAAARFWLVFSRRRSRCRRS